MLEYFLTRDFRVKSSSALFLRFGPHVSLWERGVLLTYLTVSTLLVSVFASDLMYTTQQNDKIYIGARVNPSFLKG